MSDVTQSMPIEITAAQRRKIYATINQWNDKEYSLVDRNCVSFVAEVLVKAGFDAPKITLANAMPTSYMRDVKKSVKEQLKEGEVQDRIDEANTERDAALAAADEARRERDRAIEAKKQAEEELKNRQNRPTVPPVAQIPAGWVKCTCPEIHANVGMLVGGDRWHTAALTTCSR